MVSAGWRFALALLVVVAPSLAAAADLPPQAPPPPTAPAAYVPAVPDWIVTIGVEGRIIPAFPGAADKKLGWSALPLFSIRKQARRRTSSVRATVSASTSSISACFSSARRCNSSIGARLRIMPSSSASRCRLRRPGRRFRQFLAGVVAATAWRGSPRHRRRDRRDRRRCSSMRSCRSVSGRSRRDRG